MFYVFSKLAPSTDNDIMFSFVSCHVDIESAERKKQELVKYYEDMVVGTRSAYSSWAPEIIVFKRVG